jgi:hypothetical protein
MLTLVDLSNFEFCVFLTSKRFREVDVDMGMISKNNNLPMILFDTNSCFSFLN